MNESKLIIELNRIRIQMDLDLRKAKQQLTNLITNIIEKKGKLYATN